MLSIILESNDPYLNLACEDYLLHNTKDEFLILSINDPSVIIGKHQVAHREVNTRFVEKNNIPVVRRISGGGTVYHDRGNLNYSFIRQSEQGRQIDFRLHTQPVINFLHFTGVEAVFGGKNDLNVNGLKISGNAEHVFRERVLHHGTLLFDASLDNLRQSLKQNTENYCTRAVESNRTPVANLKNMYPDIKDTGMFMTIMLEYFRLNMTDIHPFSFSAEDISAIQSLAEIKYRSWEWNYGYGPPYTFTNRFDVNEKSHNCKLLVRDGIIRECDIEGSTEMAAAGEKLIGRRHLYADMLEVFRAENIPVSEDDIFNFF
jgi:lipoate---protein ligase